MFYNTLYDAFLVSRAGIPALNRWNRIYWPVVWWPFACAFYYLIALAIIEASQDELDKSVEDGGVIDPLAPRTEDTTHVEKKMPTKQDAWVA